MYPRQNPALGMNDLSVEGEVARTRDNCSAARQRTETGPPTLFSYSQRVSKESRETISYSQRPERVVDVLSVNRKPGLCD